MPTYCIHGMNASVCALCNKPTPTGKKPIRRPRKPAHRPAQTKTVHGAGSLKAGEILNAEAVCITPKHNHSSFAELGSQTTFVHFLSHPFLWAVKEVLKRAPNLKTVQVLPSFYDKLNKDGGHFQACEARGVEICPGHWRPDMAWRGTGRIVNPDYANQRDFLLGLKGEQKLIFEELLKLGFEEALIVARYFCVNGETYMPQFDVGREFGFPRTTAVHHVSDLIGTIFVYLDPTFEGTELARARARTLKRRVARIRSFNRDEKERRSILKELGVTSMPKGMPPSRLDVYRKLRPLWVSGVLSTLPNRLRYVLTERYGLDEKDHRFRTLQMLGDKMDLTRERIRQLEEEALKALGIKDE